LHSSIVWRRKNQIRMEKIMHVMKYQLWPEITLFVILKISVHERSIEIKENNGHHNKMPN
jgi:hypothetical protein